MATPVVKLAQPGYDVATAGDENLIYSSEWPVLPIYMQDTASFNPAINNVLAKHDLGFPPVFWYFSNLPETAWENFGTASAVHRSDFFGPIGGGTIGIDSGSLFYKGTSFGMDGTVRLYYYIIGLDLTKQFNAPIIKVGAIAGGSDTSRVFKIIKDGKKMDSKDLSDYVVHSRARSPLVHSVNPSPGAVKSFVVEHDLGYVPMFFAYSQDSATGRYNLMPTGQGGSSQLISDVKNITYNDSGAKQITIVILKDPFLVDYSVRVTV